MGVKIRVSQHEGGRAPVPGGTGVGIGHGVGVGTSHLALGTPYTLHLTPYIRICAEREGNNLKRFGDFRTENGSSQGHNLASTA